jgi:probable F420-dependent oxidoreductase
MTQDSTSSPGRSLSESFGPLGLWTRQLDVQPMPVVRDTLAELEQLGWESLWYWEVFGREALCNAALLLSASDRMLIASGVANIWARDPTAMAAAQRTLTEAYPGRFVLGIGVSHGPVVDPRGHTYEKPVEKMRKYLDAMDAAPFQGPPMSEQPTRVLAALGPEMTAMAAQRSGGGTHLQHAAGDDGGLPCRARARTDAGRGAGGVAGDRP